jgi:glycosyltransferase involved in cell wall biosynthesis
LSEASREPARLAPSDSRPERPLRIIQAIETGGPGGAERVLLSLCRRLAARGHAVTALLLKSGWLEQQLREQGTDVRLLDMGYAADGRFLRSLARTVRELGADVVHSHEIAFALYGRLATVRSPASLVSTAHGKNFSRGWKRRLLGTLLLRPGRRFSLVGVSSDLCAHLQRGFLLRKGSVTLVPNGVDLRQPRERGLSESGTLRLVAVGNLYPVKNHQLVVRAVAELRVAGVDARLVILGRGAEQQALERLIASLGLHEQVTLAGFREDVGRFLDDADVLVSASVSEGMPLSFIEAMSGGLPVVASRVGGVP